MAEGETVKAMEGEAENGQSEMEVLTMQVLSNGLVRLIFREASIFL